MYVSGPEKVVEGDNKNKTKVHINFTWLKAVKTHILFENMLCLNCLQIVPPSFALICPRYCNEDSLI